MCLPYSVSVYCQLVPRCHTCQYVWYYEISHWTLKCSVMHAVRLDFAFTFMNSKQQGNMGVNTCNWLFTTHNFFCFLLGLDSSSLQPPWLDPKRRRKKKAQIKKEPSKKIFLNIMKDTTQRFKVFIISMCIYITHCETTLIYPVCVYPKLQKKSPRRQPSFEFSN